MTTISLQQEQLIGGIVIELGQPAGKDSGKQPKLDPLGKAMDIRADRDPSVSRIDGWPQMCSRKDDVRLWDANGGTPEPSHYVMVF